MTWDPTQTDQARSNRARKVEVIVLHGWQRGLSGDDVAAMTSRQRSRLARAAGVRVPNRGSVTWPLVVDRLRAFEVAAQTDPWHPLAWQRLTGERDQWLRP